MNPELPFLDGYKISHEDEMKKKYASNLLDILASLQSVLKSIIYSFTNWSTICITKSIY